MKKEKLYVIKNVKTKKYYIGPHYSQPWTKNIHEANVYNKEDKRIYTKDPEFENFLEENEKFVEIEIKERIK